MTEKEFIDLKREINDILTVTESNISSKLLSYPRIVSKYLDKFNTEALKLSNMKIELDRVYSERYKFYKEKNSVLLNKGEIEIYIDSDAEYINKKKEYDQQDMYCNFLEGFKDMLVNWSYTMKDYVNFTIWQGGGK